MKPIIETVELTKTFKVGKVEVPVLRGVDLRVEEGEFLAVMGPSGCGKSTLIHLLGGLLQPTSGKIFIDGVEITKLSDKQRTEFRRNNISYIFQRFNLFPTLSAKDNIELARQIHGNGFREHGRTEEILSLLGLKSKVDHKPSELSIGEQQRVAIARAVINKPRIILADEPTGSLDSENSRMVLNMLRELNTKYNQTLLMITHDLDAASVADRTSEMRDGRVLRRLENFFYDAEYEGLF